MSIVERGRPCDKKGDVGCFLFFHCTSDYEREIVSMLKPKYHCKVELQGNVPCTLHLLPPFSLFLASSLCLCYPPTSWRHATPSPFRLSSAFYQFQAPSRPPVMLHLTCWALLSRASSSVPVWSGRWTTANFPCGVLLQRVAMAAE